MSVGDDSDSETADALEGNLLEMTGAAVMNAANKPKKSTTVLASGDGSLAARCRAASETLNYLLKPSPMKPTGAKAQRKKYQTPVGVDIEIDTPIDLSIFSIFIEEEKTQRAKARLTLEAVSFTQQQPLRVSDNARQQNMTHSMDAFSSDDIPSLSTNLNGNAGEMNGVGSTFHTSAGQQQGSMMQRNTLDRPQTASDPFYLNSTPSNNMLDAGDNDAMVSRFGMIQLGDAGGDSDEEEHDATRKKRKKKKKEKKSSSSAQDVDLRAIFGGVPPNQGPAQNVTVYTSDDDEDEAPAYARGKGQSRKRGANKEFQGLAQVDLTMPLREDEVMPERKHHVVPEKTTQHHGFEDAPAAVSKSDPKSKKKKKKKESKKKSSSRREAAGPDDVGDLLDLGGFSSVPEAAPQAAPASSIFDSKVTPVAPVQKQPMQGQNNAISNAFDDLLGLSDNAPVPQLAGAPLALTAGQSSTHHAFGGLSMGAPMQASVPPPPAESPGKAGKRPWIRGIIKTSHSSGSPVVDWSKVQLLFRVYKSSGTVTVAASVAVKVTNYMEMSSLNDLTLNLKDFGNVSIGTVASGSSAESSKVGPFSYPATDSPHELKGTLSTADCHVPIKLHLPVAMHFAPLEGLALEDVAQQLGSSQWSSLSTKLPVSVGPDHIKPLISSFLRLAEVEPNVSGPSNGTFAGQSAGSGAQIRLLAKVKKDKVKIDLKTTNAQLGEAIISDLKRLAL